MVRLLRHVIVVMISIVLNFNPPMRRRLFSLVAALCIPVVGSAQIVSAVGPVVTGVNYQYQLAVEAVSATQFFWSARFSRGSLAVLRCPVDIRVRHQSCLLRTGS
jgi:hypothetical protein